MPSHCVCQLPLLEHAIGDVLPWSSLPCTRRNYFLVASAVVLLWLAFRRVVWGEVRGEVFVEGDAGAEAVEEVVVVEEFR